MSVSSLSLPTATPHAQVLVAADTAGRVLEVVLALEAAWAREGLPYPVMLAGPLAGRALAAVGSLVEWMADALQRAFEFDRRNPFDLK